MSAPLPVFWVVNVPTVLRSVVAADDSDACPLLPSNVPASGLDLLVKVWLWLGNSDVVKVYVSSPPVDESVLFVKPAPVPAPTGTRPLKSGTLKVPLEPPYV